MESFIVGIVTMVVFVLSIATVLGVLKLMSLTKRVFKLQRRLEDNERELTRDITMVDQTMNNQIHHFSQDFHRRIDESVTQSKSYTDHRIDKLVDVYFDVRSAKKSVLKD
jgi:biopolymer transport protein ExbB/TolQ